MVTIIQKNESIGEIKEKLNTNHGIATPFGWEIVFGMLLDECESHIEVHGYGHSAYFSQR
ncbi:hypothetical protein [Alkaliphilus sp. B6464]|uniref:hypothetical protein n=1 Tax=Alkaliphilus sp. B6464 TaxID=2731219 RepID=UPI001BA74829|nr:hypothetical protein [Alkaliphilus sp. B6464]QUH22186.1 hypothetical protein HYG84_19970 [Alkaliphilus sp. B6464]